jgi:hypothetical protein
VVDVAAVTAAAVVAAVLLPLHAPFWSVPFCEQQSPTFPLSRMAPSGTQQNWPGVAVLSSQMAALSQQLPPLAQDCHVARHPLAPVVPLEPPPATPPL